MRLIILLTCLTLLNVDAFSIKLFYNENNELTIEELATHYRICEIDIDKKQFVGLVSEYNLQDSLLTELMYDSTGHISSYSEISDSLKKSIELKEKFVQSKFIRKNDYTQIKELLPPLPLYDETNKSIKQSLFKIVESFASFPGGNEMMLTFLSHFLYYPEEAVENNITGTVEVEFQINTDGTLSNIKVIKGIGYGCDEAAKYAIRKLPDWKPSYQQEKPVPTILVIPIKF